MTNLSLIFGNEYGNISFQVSVLANETCKRTFWVFIFAKLTKIEKFRENLVPQRIVYIKKRSEWVQIRKIVHISSADYFS